ncbi:unnamed protein product, partial [Polarella glacialis]
MPSVPEAQPPDISLATDNDSVRFGSVALAEMSVEIADSQAHQRYMPAQQGDPVIFGPGTAHCQYFHMSETNVRNHVNVSVAAPRGEGAGLGDLLGNRPPVQCLACRRLDHFPTDCRKCHASLCRVCIQDGKCNRCVQAESDIGMSLGDSSACFSSVSDVLQSRLPTAASGFQSMASSLDAAAGRPPGLDHLPRGPPLAKSSQPSVQSESRRFLPQSQDSSEERFTEYLGSACNSYCEQLRSEHSAASANGRAQKISERVAESTLAEALEALRTRALKSQKEQMRSQMRRLRKKDSAPADIPIQFLKSRTVIKEAPDLPKVKNNERAPPPSRQKVPKDDSPPGSESSSSDDSSDSSHAGPPPLIESTSKDVAEKKRRQSQARSPLPKPGNLRAWRALVRGKTTAASGRPDECFAWLSKAHEDGATFESLSDTGSFKTLDMKFATALTEISTGPLGVKITTLADEEASRGRLIKGRQLYLAILEWHKLDEARGAFFSLKDLMAQDCNTLEILFLDQIEACKAELGDELVSVLGRGGAVPGAVATRTTKEKAAVKKAVKAAAASAASTSSGQANALSASQKGKNGEKKSGTKSPRAGSPAGKGQLPSKFFKEGSGTCPNWDKCTFSHAPKVAAMTVVVAASPVSSSAPARSVIFCGKISAALVRVSCMFQGMTHNLMCAPRDLGYHRSQPSAQFESRRIARAQAFQLASECGHAFNEPIMPLPLLVSAAAVSTENGPTRYFADTGAGKDLVSRGELSAQQLRCLRKPRQKFMLRAAAGIIEAKEEVDLDVPLKAKSDCLQGSRAMLEASGLPTSVTNPASSFPGIMFPFGAVISFRPPGERGQVVSKQFPILLGGESEFQDIELPVRVLIEFACSPDSALGLSSTSLPVAQALPFGGSLPCTPLTRWRSMNVLYLLNGQDTKTGGSYPNTSSSLNVMLLDYSREMEKFARFQFPQDPAGLIASAVCAEADVINFLEASHRVPITPQPHRDKQSNPPLWSSLVTKTLHPSDPMSRCKEALDAVNAERVALLETDTWDQSNPMEKKTGIAKCPDAHFASLFSIVGIKNHESPADHKWKGRIVFGSDKIKTAAEAQAFFDELTSTPASMQAGRCLLAGKSSRPWLRLKQSDCLRAYVQSFLGVPNKIFVDMPRAWWPPEWAGKFDHPVVDLRKALYGHPLAGERWRQRLEDESLALGFHEIEGWPSVYAKCDGIKQATVFVVYVDDLVMVGGEDLDIAIAGLRKHIDMEDPREIYKYLDTPFAPELPRDQQVKLMEETGTFSAEAASLLMKPMYGARLARPDLCVTQILDLPPEERSANLERYARCMTVRFRRRKANQEELDLQALMPSSLAQSPEVWEYTSCAICLCEFAEGEELRRAPCAGGHAFHPKCLRGWLDRSHATCPVCRGGEGDGRGGRSKPQGGRFGADALAEFVTRRMRSGKVDLTVSKANHERAEMAIRQLRDPMPCLKPE